jgi:hypothetical protein
MISFEREKDEKFLSLMRRVNCLCCGAVPPVDACHIKSRGSGGGDEWFNVIPMCRNCHSLQHQVGWFSFCEKFSHVKHHLELLGWSFICKRLRRGKD